MTQHLQIGSIVESVAGHDKGRKYVVAEIMEDFALLTDGDYRPLSNPKRKRLKHIKQVVTGPIEKETLGKMHDFEVKKYLKNIAKV